MAALVVGRQQQDEGTHQEEDQGEAQPVETQEAVEWPSDAVGGLEEEGEDQNAVGDGRGHEEEWKSAALTRRQHDQVFARCMETNAAGGGGVLDGLVTNRMYRRRKLRKTSVRDSLRSQVVAEPNSDSTIQTWNFSVEEEEPLDRLYHEATPMGICMGFACKAARMPSDSWFCLS